MRELNITEVYQVNGGVADAGDVIGGAFIGGTGGFLAGVARGAAIGAGRGVLGGLGGMVLGAALGASYVVIRGAFSGRIKSKLHETATTSNES